MEIRPVKTEELIHYTGICKSVFFTDERMDIYQAIKDNNPGPDANEDESKNVVWGYFDEKGILQSALTVIPYTIRMNGKNVKMGGIGGVVTRPEYRGRGCINQIFEKAFPAMEEAGQVFSYLYPFSHRYYRMFGYELCNTLNNIDIDISSFEAFKYPKNAEALQPNQDIKPYADIYNEYTKNKNLSVVRSDDDWKQILKRDPYKNLAFAFLFKTDNKPVAYILYDVNVDNNDHSHGLNVKECCFINKDGLHQVLGFIGKLGADFGYGKVIWHNFPDDMNMYTLMAEPYDVNWSTGRGGMNRLVSVLPALKTLEAPTGSGKVVINVTDDFLKNNTGIYEISWESGTLNVKKQENTEADLITSVQTLAQLITGYTTIDQVRYKPCTTINSDGLLNKLFTKKSIYIVERF